MKLTWDHRFTLHFLSAAICFLSCFLPSASSGCVYTVRDIGFADVMYDPYRLYCYIREDTPEELKLTFEQTSYATLMDSNVEVEMVNVDRQQNHPAITYLDFWEIKSFPSAVLVSPNGRSLALPVSLPGKPFRETAWSALESVISSPNREEVLRYIVKAYCVILFIQGKNSAENEMARGVLNDAIGEIARAMSQMTKNVEQPPHLIVLPAKSFPQERVLLWSLGVDEDAASGPCVAVIYGKGRQIGPLLKGRQISRNAIFNILSIIGSSCECGFDREWVLGRMIPLKWGEGTQSEVVKLLGFDAESPMVKREMSQILSLGASIPDSEGLTGPEESALDVYREEAFQVEEKSSVAMISPAQIQELASSEPGFLGLGSTLRITLIVVGGMILSILVGGVFVLLRARKGGS